MRTPLAVIAAAAVWAACAPAGCGKQPSAPEPGTKASARPAMEKYVSPNATFVLYRPKGWEVTESQSAGLLHVLVVAPDRKLRVGLSTGAAPARTDVLGAGRLFMRPIAENYADVVIREARASRDRTRATIEGTFRDPDAGRMAFRAWITLRKGALTQTSIFTPEGQLDEAKPILLTIASNIRVMKAPPAAPATVRPLVPHRLPDGSATFKIPRGWKVQGPGKGTFLASSPEGTAHFMVAKADVLAPGVAEGVPGTVHAPFLPPHRAVELLTTQARLGSQFRFREVVPQRDLNELLARRSPGARAQAETFLFDFRDARGRPAKGFSFGMSLGSGLGINWTLWHLTVVAGAAEFDALVPTFAEMMSSYRIDDEYARRYVERGLARVREMQRQTAAMAASNAEVIRNTMQAAYDERQRSQDYIDYQRTNTIRGQQDWISEVEGGAIYHSDTWGTKNTATGEFWEGAPYDYLSFEGKNPKHPTEQMQAVDSRELWEKHVR